MYQILIVEDNRAIQRNLKSLVEKAGEHFHVCDVCQNGKRALDILNQIEVDIVITDIRMPLMDGLELIQQWRTQNKRTKYIIISGYDEFEYARRGLSLGVSEYLLKPVTFSELQTALRKTFLQIREEEEKEKRIASYKMNTEMLNTPAFNMSKEKLDQETAFFSNMLIPALLSWKQQEYLQAIEHIMEHWCEHNYSTEDLRILLLSVTELILRNKGCLNAVNMVQPVENILTFSNSYYELKKVSLEYFQALYQKINSILVENNYSSERFFEIIKNYLDGHLYCSLSMMDISENFHVSSSYINRLFRKYANVSPMTYYNSRKIEEACRLLERGGDCRIKDIAETLGYQNQNYFSKAFKAATGCTPLEYKETRQLPMKR